MYYCLSFYPQLGQESAEAIREVRDRYDPTAPYFEPHIAVVFPTHERIGKQRLIDHIQNVLSNWKPFEIQLGGLDMRPNHWLLLGLQRGQAEFKKLYKEFHTGILAGADPDKYTPHLSLGLFVKEGVAHNWFEPQESDRDEKRYQEALPLANSLPLSEVIVVDSFILGAIPDTVIEWTRGRLINIPDEAEETIIHEFIL